MEGSQQGTYEKGRLFYPSHSRAFGILKGNMPSSCLSINSSQTKETPQKPKL